MKRICTVMLTIIVSVASAHDGKRTTLNCKSQDGDVVVSMERDGIYRVNSKTQEVDRPGWYKAEKHTDTHLEINGVYSPNPRYVHPRPVMRVEQKSTGFSIVDAISGTYAHKVSGEIENFQVQATAEFKFGYFSALEKIGLLAKLTDKQKKRVSPVLIAQSRDNETASGRFVFVKKGKKATSNRAAEADINIDVIVECDIE